MGGDGEGEEERTRGTSRLSDGESGDDYAYPSGEANGDADGDADGDAGPLRRHDPGRTMPSWFWGEDDGAQMGEGGHATDDDDNDDEKHDDFERARGGEDVAALLSTDMLWRRADGGLRGAGATEDDDESDASYSYHCSDHGESEGGYRGDSVASSPRRAAGGMFWRDSAQVHVVSSLVGRNIDVAGRSDGRDADDDDDDDEEEEEEEDSSRDSHDSHSHSISMSRRAGDEKDDLGRCRSPGVSSSAVMFWG